MKDQFRDEFIKEDICPECLGELDTGWECNRCGFDANPYNNERDPETGRVIKKDSAKK